VEFGGRTVDYTYDALYRLTGETIAGAAINGTIGYTYDEIGTASAGLYCGPVSPASYAYDANDHLTVDSYDGNGNTTASGGVSYVYDFENHLKTKNGAEVVIVYDGTAIVLQRPLAA